MSKKGQKWPFLVKFQAFPEKSTKIVTVTPLSNLNTRLMAQNKRIEQFFQIHIRKNNYFGPKGVKNPQNWSKMVIFDDLGVNWGPYKHLLGPL